MSGNYQADKPCFGVGPAFAETEEQQDKKDDGEKTERDEKDGHECIGGGDKEGVDIDGETCLEDVGGGGGDGLDVAAESVREIYFGAEEGFCGGSVVGAESAVDKVDGGAPCVVWDVTRGEGAHVIDGGLEGRVFHGEDGE